MESRFFRRNRYRFRLLRRILVLINSLLVLSVAVVSDAAIATDVAHLGAPAAPPAGVPQLLSQLGSTRAVALESITWKAEPFSPDAPAFLAANRRTRIVLFALNLDLLPGDNFSSVGVYAQDAAFRTYPLGVEYVGKLPDANAITAVVVRLNEDLGDVGDVLVGLSFHGLVSNRVRIGIGHIGGGPPDDIVPMPTPTPTPTPASTPTPTPTPTPGPSSQCTWYVTTNGSSSGDGSFSSPWSLATIAGGVPDFDGGPPPPAVIRPGDTICLRGGTYVPVASSCFFRTVLAGTLGHQITIQPYPGEHVIIDPQAPAGVGPKGEIFILEGPYVTLRDLEVTDSYATNRTDARPGGIQVAQGATGAKVINNIVHDTGDGIDKNDLADDVEIYGNVIFNVGWDDRSNGLQQGGTGHGMYAANSESSFHVYNNIIAASFGFGFHFYSAGTGHLYNYDVQDNVSLNNGYWTRYHDSSYAAEGRTTDNYLIGHRSITALNFTRNFGYHREQRGGQNVEIGYSGTENISGSATNNTLIGGENTVDHFETLTFTNNYIAAFFQDLQFIAPDTPVSTTIDSNTYYFYRNDCSFQPFGLTANNTPTSVAQWKAKGFDLNSTINPCGVRDSTAKVTINPNAYDANRYHVIVNNPSSSTTVTLNLSSALANGDTFELHNAQDYYGPLVASGTYNEPISINMTTLKVATPVAYGSMPNATPLAQMTSGPQFGAFILIKKRN